jgi:hypothetical protein
MILFAVTKVQVLGIRVFLENQKAEEDEKRQYNCKTKIEKKRTE